MLAASNIDPTTKHQKLPTYDLFNSLSLFNTSTKNEWANQYKEEYNMNQGLINDFSSLSTSSFKDDFYDDYYLKQKDHQQQQHHHLHNTSSSDLLSSDNIKCQLNDAMDYIQLLNHKLKLITDDLQQKQNTITNLQSTLSVKEIELQEQNNRFIALNQLYESRQKNIYNENRVILKENADLKSKYQTLLKELESTRNRQASITPPPENVSDQIIKWHWADDNERKADYKRLLDKSVVADWDKLIKSIIELNDQQASIFLQQKVKSCSAEQRNDIFKAAHRYAYELMTNKFGNFLVQRIFEHGTSEQIHSLAKTMKGHVLSLTCEPFGSHVVQKALDYVDESTKAELVTELFDRIPETIIHKQACHVWQKVFEIVWKNHKVSVITHLHNALKGKWTRVALDETGSLVIQNIFENLSDIDKRPVLNEILDNMFTIARGQWGNWVIQHILEQADSEDREKAFEMVLHRGIQLSMDQYASKVVEKALSIGGSVYMDKFIHHITTESRSQRPRIALIDIASDQYGNYVVQWIINNAPEHHKIHVCKLIKRHMVSLRGSKYGQKVAYLVDKTLKTQDINTYPSSSTTTSSSI
ncbi:unnamed protein product [Cunninghamella blakesleeana]